MRVLVVTNMYPVESDPAFGCFVAEQLASLRAAGLDAHLYFIQGYNDRLAYARAVSDLRRQKANFDLFHAHHTFSGIAALAAGLRPLVFTIHDNAVVTSRFYRRVARWVASRADRFVAVSPAAKQALSPVPATEIPMGVNLALFRPRPPAECRRELQLAAHKKYVLFPADPGRKTKRYDLARAAVALAQADDADLDLLAMSKVPRPAVPLYFNAADVVLVTSDVELGPLTVKEAIACGRPVVSRRVGDVVFLETCPGASRSAIPPGPSPTG